MRVGLVLALAIVLAGCASTPGPSAAPEVIHDVTPRDPTEGTEDDAPTNTTTQAHSENITIVPSGQVEYRAAIPWDDVIYSATVQFQEPTQWLGFMPYNPSTNDPVDELGYGFVIKRAESSTDACAPTPAWWYIIEFRDNSTGQFYNGLAGTLDPGTYSILMWRFASYEGKPTSVPGNMKITFQSDGDNETKEKLWTEPGPYNRRTWFNEETTMKGSIQTDVNADFILMQPDITLPFPHIGEWSYSITATHHKTPCNLHSDAGFNTYITTDYTPGDGGPNPPLFTGLQNVDTIHADFTYDSPTSLPPTYIGDTTWGIHGIAFHEQ